MFKQFIKYLPVLVIKLVAKLPVSLVYACMSMIAKILMHSNLSVKRKTQLNLEIAFAHEDKETLSKRLHQSLHHSLFSMVELARVWCSPLAKLNTQILSVQGEEILLKQLREKRPIIILCPHLGCWEMVNYWINHIGYTMSALYKPTDNNYLNHFMIQARNKGGNNLVPANRRGIRQIYQDLKANQLVGILPDQVPQEDSSYVMAPFFSVDAATMTLIHTLCMKTSPSLVYISALRDSYKGFHIHIRCAQEIIQTDAVLSAKKMNEGIEKMIALAPEQYQWSYSRYRYNDRVDYKRGIISSL